MIILLDNGHGVDTPGKRSPVWGDGSRLLEYEFNRDIVRRIKRKVNNPSNVLILVPEDNDVSLTERVRRANQIAKRENNDVLLISVHANAGGGTGWEVWTSIGETLSDEYATDIYLIAKQALEPLGFPTRPDLTDGDVDKEEKFTILTKTLCPAILTENLFMDKYKDCKFIMSDSGRDLIAQIHADFINNIL